MTNVNPRHLLHLALAGIVCGCGTATAAERPQRTPAATYPAMAGPPIAVGGDTVRILPKGSTAFPVILSLIADARSSVEVEMYEFGRSDIATALVDAHRRGVPVTVIVDPSVEVSRSTEAVLRGAGVDVLDYPVRKQMIDHVKLLVVDHRVAVVGGINWGATSDRNHDVDAAITGPAATNLDRVFATDLIASGRMGGVPPPAPDDRVLVAATLPTPSIRPLVMRLIDDATTALDLELFVLTDTGVVHAVERARGRGVAVRVLLDPGQRPSDGPAAALAAAGVSVRHYRSSGEKLHAKVGVADGRTVVFGSANWTTSGFQRNHEVDVEILDVPAIAAQLTAMMEADWSASAA
ncbi:MAG TPA: phosphatidylserine/phosphatidylglycerophosphate/cardiolipin synthase family protein [Candidatus Dormibacteraeota bacterium]|jgi:phosphatidylserine/phosphatidylglycerophosphate/cardiolipin synthase-like enzyme|nr:phosphatidylserine/phosphatidylglycerophosphate/cardiolipin synthase family protein [Candidatus Dormibacteraeota bacterium]